MWLNSKAFLWPSGLDNALYKITVLHYSNEIKIVREILLNKCGHCRLTHSRSENGSSPLHVKYSGNIFFANLCSKTKEERKAKYKLNQMFFSGSFFAVPKIDDLLFYIASCNNEVQVQTHTHTLF